MTKSTRGALRTLVLAVGVVLAAPGCQDAIVDLGPVPDEELDRREELESVVNGMGRALSRALALLAQTGLFVALELTWSGNQGEYGAEIMQKDGVLNPVESDPHWNLAQQARWMAEDGARRMRQVLGETEFARSRLAAEALLYVGFANRLLAENMCQGLVDGGPPVARTVHFERAAAAFTEALEIADRVGDAGLADAALAGRASARVGLGDWVGAVADAEGVPPRFAFQALYHEAEVAQYNRIYWGSTPSIRAHTAWGTFYEGYYEATGDSRVSWTIDPDSPVVEVGVPWFIQTKYESRDAPIDLVSWEEMRLIVAEARLRAGDVEGAMEELDALRAAAGVDPWPPPADLAEAWTALKRERGIELWLEGRRLWDLHRWLAEGIPGEAEDMTGRDTCFPIGATERGTNPNVP